MNYRLFIALLSTFLLFLSCSGKGPRYKIVPHDERGLLKDEIVMLPADPAKGFYWPYLLYLPEELKDGDRLLVLPNNTGDVSDEFSLHRERAESHFRRAISYFKGRPLLMPIFPRPRSKIYGKIVYSHSLDRDTIYLKEESLGNEMAIKIRWEGEYLGEGSSMFYNGSDIIVVQDELAYRCYLADRNLKEPISDVSSFELSFIMEAGIDYSREFTFIEAIPSEYNGFLFKGVRVKGDSIVNGSCLRGSGVEIVDILPAEELLPGGIYDSSGEKVELMEYYRNDLQLIEMINDASSRIGSKYELKLKEKFDMFGFSASATFSERFSTLHPELVNSIAVGGFNGILLLPQDSYDGTSLSYPLGTADYSHITGRPFDRAAFAAVKRFIFMGSDDTNDAATYRDSYSKENEELIMKFYGKKPIERMPFLKERFAGAVGENSIFKIYEGVEHKLTREMIDDVVEFFKSSQ